MEAHSEIETIKGFKVTMHLWMHFYLLRPVFDSEQLESLHRLIVDTLPKWSSDLKVLKSEYKRSGQNVGPDSSLAEAVNQEAPARRGMGNAVLKGSYDGLSFYLDTCQSTLPPELNYVSVEIEQAVIEDETASKWAFSFFEQAVNRLPLRYARAHSSEEFAAKNMISNGDGVRAAGVQLNRSLPGIYWLNYFGVPYMKLIGRDCLLSVSAYDVREICGGVFVALDKTPAEWASEKYKTAEREVIEHIGHQFVFSRAEPDHEKVAPDFR